MSSDPASPFAGSGGVLALLARLGTDDASRAWSEFLESHASLLMRVARLTVHDTEAAGDCFLYVCEQLSKDGCRRLRGFKSDGAASFETWLRVVTRNLCLDWKRAEFGRLRDFESIRRLPEVAQQIFTEVYKSGGTLEAAYQTMSSRRRSLTVEEFDAALDMVRQALTPRQRWLLSLRSGGESSLEESDDSRENRLSKRLADTSPGPEEMAVQRQRQADLKRAVESLDGDEQMMIRLRYEEEMTLDQVAKLTGLKDAQSAHRQIDRTLEKLRKMLR